MVKTISLCDNANVSWLAYLHTLQMKSSFAKRDISVLKNIGKMTLKFGIDLSHQVASTVPESDPVELFILFR